MTFLNKVMKKLGYDSYGVSLSKEVKNNLAILSKDLLSKKNSEMEETVLEFMKENDLDKAQAQLVIEKLIKIYNMDKMYWQEMKNLVKDFEVKGLYFPKPTETILYK